MKDGKPDGISTTWHDNGQILRFYIYSN